MSERKAFSETLRIDLIPGSQPAAPHAEPQKPATSPHQRIQVKKPKAPDEPTTVSRSRYQELLQSIYDAAIVTNVFGKITDANTRATEFLRYNREELCTLQISDVISGADRTLLNTLCDALQNERFTLMQAYCRRRDGSFFPAEIAVNMLKFGQIYLCFFIRDITRRKQVEDRLRTEHEAVHHAATGVVIADLDARVEYANPAFAGLVGFEDAGDLVGGDLGTFLQPHDTVDAVIQRVKGTAEVWRGSVTLVARSGSSRMIELCATCSRDADGDPMNLVFSVTEPSGAAAAQGTDEAYRLRQELDDALARVRALTGEVERLRSATPAAQSKPD
jgi:PAS domain S-box-containing protein